VPHACLVLSGALLRQQCTGVGLPAAHHHTPSNSHTNTNTHAPPRATQTPTHPRTPPALGKARSTQRFAAAVDKLDQMRGYAVNAEGKCRHAQVRLAVQCVVRRRCACCVVCCAVPCCAVPCCAVPCCAALCCAVLCCAVLCCVRGACGVRGMSDDLVDTCMRNRVRILQTHTCDSLLHTYTHSPHCFRAPQLLDYFGVLSSDLPSRRCGVSCDVCRCARCWWGGGRGGAGWGAGACRRRMRDVKTHTHTHTHAHTHTHTRAHTHTQCVWHTRSARGRPHHRQPLHASRSPRALPHTRNHNLLVEPTQGRGGAAQPRGVGRRRRSSNSSSSSSSSRRRRPV
jgi:hypothetical protein